MQSPSMEPLWAPSALPTCCPISDWTIRLHGTQTRRGTSSLLPGNDLYLEMNFSGPAGSSEEVLAFSCSPHIRLVSNTPPSRWKWLVQLFALSLTMKNEDHHAVIASVADPNQDPDPHVFVPPGSGSFYQHAKIVRKTLIHTILWLFFTFLFLKNDVNVASKSNKQKNCVKTLVFCLHLEGQWWKWQDPDPGSGSISQRHGSADPDPPQNVMDPQHWL